MKSRFSRRMEHGRYADDGCVAISDVLRSGSNGGVLTRKNGVKMGTGDTLLRGRGLHLLMMTVQSLAAVGYWDGCFYILGQ